MVMPLMVLPKSLTPAHTTPSCLSVIHPPLSAGPPPEPQTERERDPPRRKLKDNFPAYRSRNRTGVFEKLVRTRVSVSDLRCQLLTLTFPRLGGFA